LSQRERRFQLAGWILFLVCALFFMSSAALNGDILYLVGSIIFFVGCIVFVIPLISNDTRYIMTRQDRKQDERDNGTVA